jgi:tetratricopeptide (TPR) repeat protein
MSDAFPFLFYGTSPDDWFDDEVHAWELRFRSPPTIDDRDRIAGAFERAFARAANESRHDTNVPWLWSGAWALVRVRLGSRTKKARKQLAAQMQDVLRAVHREVELAAVSALHAADISSNDPWEEWSVVRAPTALDGPRWPVAVPMSSDRESTECREDRVFEESRARVRNPPPPATPEEPADEPPAEPVDRAISAPEDAATEDETEDETEDDDGGERESNVKRHAVTAGKRVALTAQKLDEEREIYEVPPEVRQRFGGSTSVKRSPSGRWIGWHKRSKKEWVFAWERADSTRVETEEVRKRPNLAFDITNDDLAAFMFDERSRHVLEAKLETGEVEELYSLPKGAWNQLVALSAGRFAVVSYEELLLCQSGQDGVTEIGRYEYPDGGSAYAFDGGRILFLQCWGDWAVIAIGFHKDQARELGRLSSNDFGIEDIGIDGSRVLLLDYDGKWHLLQGYEEAYREAFEGGVEYPEPGVWEAPKPEGASDDESDDADGGDPDEDSGDPDQDSDDDEGEGSDEGDTAEDDGPPAPAKLDNAEESYGYGCDFKGDDEHARAVEYFARAVELDPNYAEAWHNLAVCQRATGDAVSSDASFERAIEMYTKRIQDDPDDAESRFWRAGVKCLTGDRDGALAELRETIERGGNHYRKRALYEEDFESLREDPEFQALTAKRGTAKKAAAKKPAAATDGEEE